MGEMLRFEKHLTPRLAAVAAFVLPGRRLADIGTDHAYLPACLVAAGKVPGAVATDVLPGPLEAARATVAEANLADRIELRLGDGLTVLKPGEVATISICGMGGPLIAEILAAGVPAGVERLALQPMGGEERLRAWLLESGWRIVGESLVEDAGRIYVIMAAEPGPMRLTPGEMLAGPFILRTGGPLLARYIGMQLKQAQEALAGARRSARPEAGARVQELTERVRLLEEVLAYAGRDHR